MANEQLRHVGNGQNVLLHTNGRDQAPQKASPTASEISTPEQIAYRLLGFISRLERRAMHAQDEGRDQWTKADRKWILDTYAECILAVHGKRQRQGFWGIRWTIKP